MVAIEDAVEVVARSNLGHRFKDGSRAKAVQVLGRTFATEPRHQIVGDLAEWTGAYLRRRFLAAIFFAKSCAAKHGQFG